MGATGKAANKRRQALCETLTAILNVARAEHVDAILCGGDLYEHERFSPDTVSFLRSAFEQADPIRIFVSPGNHDWYGPQSIYRTNEWSPNVHIFTSSKLEPFELEDGLTLWGAAHLAPAGTGNFLERFTVDRSGTNIALFHGSEMGAFPFQEPDKQAHAPFVAREIKEAGLRHAFLGHFHTPRDEELYTYPGNPDPLTFGETGNRAVVIADLGDDGTLTRRRIPVARTMAHDLPLDITGCSSLHEVLERLRSQVDGLRGVARITVGGELAPEVNFEPSALKQIDCDLDDLMVVTGDVRAAYDLDRLKQEQTVRGEFVRSVLKSNLPEDDTELVLRAGLRALDGRSDLEVL
jgi:DNA repair exonuclease SbcCD nuclease subunit